MNFGGAASQGFQQQSISMPNLSATIEVEDVAGDTGTDLDSFTTNQPRANLRNQAQSSRQSDRLREKVVIEEGIDAEDGSDFELQTIVVPRNLRNNRANPY